MMVNRIQNTDCLSVPENAANKIFESDEFLWSRYLATNDRRLFDQLVHRHEDEIYRHLYRLLGNAQLAEDARQGTFLKMHLKSNQFHPGRPLKPWLYAIATHEAIDLQRKNKRHRMQSLDQNQTRDENAPHNLLHRLESNVSAPGQKLEREEIKTTVRRSVNNLPLNLREPLNLVYYEGLKIREAADQLGIPQGTVKSRMRRAIRLLNRTFKEFPSSASLSSQSTGQPAAIPLDKSTSKRRFEICCKRETQGCSVTEAVVD
jgi:RNA polymerase sigma-70 factor (ECF subfamily)